MFASGASLLARGWVGEARGTLEQARGRTIDERWWRSADDNPAKDLQGATLYTSGEPCPMGMGAIVWCGLGRVVYAASIAQLEKRIGQIMIPSKAVAQAAPSITVDITGGVLATEALALFDRK